MNINVSIERLVLDGLPMSRSQGVLVQVAIETELARLLTVRGLAPLPDTAVPSLAASNIQVAEQPCPTRLGQQIAQAVYAAVGTENSAPITRQSDGGLR